MDSAIIIVIGSANTYALDSDLSGGYCHPMFEQLEPLLVLSDQGCSLNFITDGKWH